MILLFLQEDESYAVSIDSCNTWCDLAGIGFDELKKAVDDYHVVLRHFVNGCKYIRFTGVATTVNGERMESLATEQQLFDELAQRG